jgi:hypothetical protein
MLADERQAHINLFEGPMLHALFNKRGRHAWWNDFNYWEIMANLCARLPPPAPRSMFVSSPLAPRATSSSSLRLAKLRLSTLASHPSGRSLPEIALWTPKTKPKVESQSAPRVGRLIWFPAKSPKLETKTKPVQPKLDPKLEPELESPSLPPPSPKPWRGRYSIPLVLSYPGDGEWADLNAALRSSAAKSVIITINDDDVGNGKCGGLG